MQFYKSGTIKIQQTIYKKLNSTDLLELSLNSLVFDDAHSPAAGQGCELINIMVDHTQWLNLLKWQTVFYHC